MAELPNVERLVEKWRTQSLRKPLRILVGGKTGVGKSALINKLLGKELCEEGFGFDAVSTSVRKVTAEFNGVHIEIFDTPGLENMSDRSEESIVAEISVKVEEMAAKELDLFFYCKPITERGTKEDETILRILTRTFGHELWKRGIIVLTKANQVNTRYKAEYPRQVQHFEERLKSILQQIKVEASIVSAIPVHTAGYTDPVIPCEADATHNYSPNWKITLIAAALEKADPESVPALFEIALKSMWEAYHPTKFEAGVATATGVTVAGLTLLAALKQGKLLRDTKLIAKTCGEAAAAGTAAGTAAGGAAVGGMVTVVRWVRLKYEMWNSNWPKGESD